MNVRVLVPIAALSLSLFATLACRPPDAGESAGHFPLAGKHAPLSCAQCHTNGRLTGAPDTCAGCHEGVRPANHYPGDCGSCHTTDGWLDGMDHSFFPLVGGHEGVACAECHEPGNVSTLTPACASCHESKRPSPHSQAGCENCHDVYGWEGAVVDHSFFPLIGGHNGVVCESCHVGGATPASQACETCHLPDRPASHFDMPCAQCHTVWGWGTATVDHSFFPWIGNHAGLECEQCHVNGTRPASKECETCHIAERPASHFTGQCSTCHDPYGWDRANFDHNPYFPVPHEGNGDCGDCHLTASYSDFSCIHCHDHRKSRMDSKHAGRSGYSYDSNACLRCHPRGRE